MHEEHVLVNRLGSLSLPRKSVVRLTDRPDMTLDVYRGRKTTIQQQQQIVYGFLLNGGQLLKKEFPPLGSYSLLQERPLFKRVPSAREINKISQILFPLCF